MSYVRGVKFLGYSFYVNKGKCLLAVHPKTKTKMKAKLKELTSRSNGWGYELRKQKLKEYILGWIGYYHLGQIKRLCLETDEWLRRRIRMCIWKAWKKPKTCVPEYNLSYSPAKSKNYMLYCNGNFIGGLFDEELCFVYADSVSELLGHPEPVYRGYSSTAQHRMLVIPEEHWSKALKLLYAEKFDWSRLVYDITYTSIGAAVVEDFYDENVVFLRFCFEKELLKKNPLDRQGRILRMVYLNQDLTKAGKYLFPRLMQKFLVFTDRNGKTSLETMLKRWYTQLEKEYRNQTAG